VQGLSVKVKYVHTEFAQALESDAITYLIVTKNTWNDLILQNEQEAEDRGEDQGFSITDNAILEALERIRFASIHPIAKMLFIPHSNVFSSLTK
jgi:hypothetical protein